MLQIEIEKLPSFVMGLEKGIEQGIEQGAKKRACIVARKLLAKGMPVEEIVEITGLSSQDIETLK